MGPRRLQRPTISAVVALGCLAVAAALAVWSTGLWSTWLAGTGTVDAGWAPVSGPGPWSTLAAAEEPDEPATTSGLRVHLTLPARLAPGRAAPLRLEVTDAGGSRLPDDRLLQVELTTAPTDATRGRVFVTPSRLLVSAEEVTGRNASLVSLASAPCDEATGEIQVVVRELAPDGQLGELTRALPELPCDLDVPPPAPDTLHVTEPVCADGFREDEDGDRNPWCPGSDEDDDGSSSTSGASSDLPGDGFAGGGTAGGGDDAADDTTPNDDGSGDASGSDGADEDPASPADVPDDGAGDDAGSGADSDDGADRGDGRTGDEGDDQSGGEPIDDAPDGGDDGDGSGQGEGTGDGDGTGEADGSGEGGGADAGTEPSSEPTDEGGADGGATGSGDPDDSAGG